MEIGVGEEEEGDFERGVFVVKIMKNFKEFYNFLLCYHIIPLF